MINKINIESLIPLLTDHVIYDVRSPSEYAHAHIPHAKSLPLFSDEERSEIGTLYKQVSRQEAVKKGLYFFKDKMLSIINTVSQENDINNESKIYLYCWRGGMRSASVAWLLSLYGYQVYTLTGGYKSYRRWALAQFEKDYNCSVLGGYTGSGKTDLLNAMSDEQFIDLEAIARHRGSAFGALDLPQPGQEAFENKLALALYKLQDHNFWIEDESRRIGDLNIPKRFWETMRRKPVYFLEIPFDKRLDNIYKDYGDKPNEILVNSITRIRKRLGPLETKTALQYLESGEKKRCFSILLKYYDKYYSKSLGNRNNAESSIIRIDASNLSNQQIINVITKK